MASEKLHEAAEDLAPKTRDMHRALLSLMEELEAVDWYAQRIDATGDAELARVLAHNMDEEKEHAAMTLEWIRRHDPEFDAQLRKYLFRSGPIVDEEREERETPGASLGIGSLRSGANGSHAEKEART